MAPIKGNISDLDADVEDQGVEQGDVVAGAGEGNVAGGQDEARLQAWQEGSWQALRHVAVHLQAHRFALPHAPVPCLVMEKVGKVFLCDLGRASRISQADRIGVTYIAL